MKGRTLTLLGILAAVVAAALIIARSYITPLGVVITGGTLFILAGLANTIAISRCKSSSMGRMFGYMTNAAAIVFGICMIVFQGSFVPLVTFIFGVLVALLAIWQFYVLASAVKPYSLPAWLYVFPILLSACAVYILVTKNSPQALPVILSTGISIGILALGSLIEGGMLGAARRIAKKTATESQSKPANDAEIKTESDEANSKAANTSSEDATTPNSGSDTQSQTTDDATESSE